VGRGRQRCEGSKGGGMSEEQRHAQHALAENSLPKATVTHGFRGAAQSPPGWQGAGTGTRPEGETQPPRGQHPPATPSTEGQGGNNNNTADTADTRSIHDEAYRKHVRATTQTETHGQKRMLPQPPQPEQTYNRKKVKAAARGCERAAAHGREGSTHMHGGLAQGYNEGGGAGEHDEGGRVREVIAPDAGVAADGGKHSAVHRSHKQAGRHRVPG
jgi:hypothetical protein